MNTPFSDTSAALRMMFFRPIRALMLMIVVWCTLMLFWAVATRVPVTVASDILQIEWDGLISAEFSPDTTITVGQEAMIRLKGLQSDVLPARVVDVQPGGRVSLQLTNPANWLLLTADDTQIDIVQIIVGQQSPFAALLNPQ